MKPRQVKTIRKKLKLTQLALAEALGCRSNTVARWESGVHPPSPPYVRLLKIMATTNHLTFS